MIRAQERQSQTNTQINLGIKSLSGYETKPDNPRALTNTRVLEAMKVLQHIYELRCKVIGNT